MQIQQALAWAKSQLASSDSAALDARVLLAFMLDTTQAWLLTWPDKMLSEAQFERFRQLIAQRAEGRPVAHITGYRDFWSLTLEVSPTTLIPRPDTEILVEQALMCLPAVDANVLDLGTGTGAVALAIASECASAQVTGVDIVADAVALAKDNARRNAISNATFLQSNWFDAVQGEQFSVIVSNPPYVETRSPYLSQGDVRFEPASALTSGHDGLDDIRKIICQARGFLNAEGWLLLEHGFDQGEAIQALMRNNKYEDIATICDLAGHPRVTLGRR